MLKVALQQKHCTFARKGDKYAKKNFRWAFCKNPITSFRGFLKEHTIVPSGWAILVRWKVGSLKKTWCVPLETPLPFLQDFSRVFVSLLESDQRGKIFLGRPKWAVAPMAAATRACSGSSRWLSTKNSASSAPASVSVPAAVLGSAPASSAVISPNF